MERCNWIPFEIPPASFKVTAKIRYNHAGTPATIEPLPGDQARVRLHEPQRAITPGQACVFYQDDLVVECPCLEIIQNSEVIENVQVIIGMIPGNITKALNGERVGTIIHKQ